MANEPLKKLQSEFITVTYRVVDAKAFAAKNPLNYEHDGVRSVAVSLGDLHAASDEVRSNVERLCDETHGLGASDADRILAPFDGVDDSGAEQSDESFLGRALLGPTHGPEADRFSARLGAFVTGLILLVLGWKTRAYVHDANVWALPVASVGLGLFLIVITLYRWSRPMNRMQGRDQK